MPSDEPRANRQRCPERTVLYRVIQQHLESFLQHVHDASGKRLPKYVENEFRRYLECGLHAHGFARAVCETCGDELLLPFSCKLRGICRSCNARRMSNTAAHLIDHVIAPDLTLRQWVLTVPFELRLLLAAKPEALSAIGRIFVQEIHSLARKHGYRRSEDDEDPAENADTTSPWMRCLQGSLGVGELQRWAEHGSPEQSRDPARRLSLPKSTKGLSAEHLKFNLHAGVSVPGGLPAAHERLLRYCARPPLALERLSVLDDGRICYGIKDTEQVRLMTPVQFLARLARIGAPTPLSVGAFLWILGVAKPVAQRRGHSGSRANNAPSPAQPPLRTIMCIPVTSAGVTLIDGCGETAPAPTPDGATAPSVLHPSSPKPLRPSAAVQPSAEPEPLGPFHVAGEELRFRRLSRLTWATSLRHRSARVLEPRRTDARRRSDRRHRPRPQRAPSSKPARAATAAVSRTLTRLGRLTRPEPPDRASWRASSSLPSRSRATAEAFR